MLSEMRSRQKWTDDSVSPRDIELARRVVLEHLSGHTVRVWLFGSAAWGGAVRSSDIDVGVLAEEPVPVDMIANLQDALDHSQVLRSVEVFDMRRVAPELRRRVIEEGIPWMK